MPRPAARLRLYLLSCLVILSSLLVACAAPAGAPIAAAPTVAATPEPSPTATAEPTATPTATTTPTATATATATPSPTATPTLPPLPGIGVSRSEVLDSFEGLEIIFDDPSLTGAYSGGEEMVGNFGGLLSGQVILVGPEEELTELLMTIYLPWPPSFDDNELSYLYLFSALIAAVPDWYESLYWVLEVYPKLATAGEITTRQDSREIRLSLQEPSGDLGDRDLVLQVVGVK